MKFTSQQLADFKAYEDVRSEGRFNMFDENARILTGLSKEEYLFVMKNYVHLRAAIEANGRS